MEDSQIIIFKTNNEEISIDVRLDDETVWLTMEQMAMLFEKSRSTINEHILNVYAENELVESESMRKIGISDFSTKPTNLYNLDVIISVGYRVKSQRGTQFRIWATGVLKEYLFRGYAMNQRVEQLEHRMGNVEEKVEFFVKTALPPKEGVFFDGQIFDAYTFASSLIKRAKKQVVLLDNYVDETVLLLLSKRMAAVKAEIYTRKVSQQLQLDLTKHNAQYAPITIHTSAAFHDRFLLIDNTAYHIGASLKDLGKKLFAFSEMDVKPAELLKHI